MQQSDQEDSKISEVVPYLITSIEIGDSRLLGSQLAGDLVINPIVGCRYFSPGPCLHSQPKRSLPLAGTKLYCLVTEAHMCRRR